MLFYNWKDLTSKNKLKLVLILRSQIVGEDHNINHDAELM